MFTIKFTVEAEQQLMYLKTTKGLRAQFKAAGNAIAYMNVNLRNPSLNTHKFDGIKSPFDGDVFESYAQNKTPEAYRIFWAYGSNKSEIMMLAITPHP